MPMGTGWISGMSEQSHERVKLRAVWLDVSAARERGRSLTWSGKHSLTRWHVRAMVLSGFSLELCVQADTQVRVGS